MPMQNSSISMIYMFLEKSGIGNGPCPPQITSLGQIHLKQYYSVCNLRIEKKFLKQPAEYRSPTSLADPSNCLEAYSITTEDMLLYRDPIIKK